MEIALHKVDDPIAIRNGHLAMLSFSLLVAGSFSLGGMISNEISPAALNAVRLSLSSILVAVLLHRRGALHRNTFRAPWRFLILGALFAIYFVAMFTGLETSLPVSISAVFTLTPVMSAMFGWLLLRQITTPHMALALLVGAIGALWVIFRADLGAFLNFSIGKGELIFFWGVIAHALFTPLARRLNWGESPVVMALGSLTGASVLLWIFGWSDIVATNWTGLRWLVWATIAYTAVFAGALTFVLIQFATLRLPASKVMAYTYLTPSWVILWEVALGHGAPNGLIFVGICLTIVALGMLLKDK